MHTWSNWLLRALVVAYGFALGLHPVQADDTFFMLNDARWLVEHHEIPWTDHFSYTTTGSPWIYPLGGSLLFYGLWLVGGYTALLLFCSLTTAAVTALLLRAAPCVLGAGLTAVSIPLIAVRTSAPRGDAFTTLFFAVHLMVLWHYHRTGPSTSSGGRLWLLPAVMVLWVNAHLGFIAGIAQLAGYVLAELLECFWPARRHAAMERLEQAWPWLIASVGATLINPFGWHIYPAAAATLGGFMANEGLGEWMDLVRAMGLAQRVLGPWGGIGFDAALGLVLLAAAVGAVAAIAQRKLGAAVFLLGAVSGAVVHVRGTALLGIVTVVVGTPVLADLSRDIWRRVEAPFLAGLCLFLGALAVATAYAKFPPRALSEEIPVAAVEFIKTHHLPANVLAFGYGSYFTWVTDYPNFTDARQVGGASNYGLLWVVTQWRPDAIGWDEFFSRWGVQTILAVPPPPLRRLAGWCVTSHFIPVFLDQTAAVFVRNSPANAAFEQLRIKC